MSRNIWTVFVYEFKRNVSRKGFLFTTFGLPVVGFIILFGGRLLAREASSDPQVLEFDLEGVSHAGYVDFSGAFPEPGELAASVMTRYESEAEAQQALNAEEINVYYVIDAEYLENGHVTLVAPRFSIAQITGAPMQQLFYSQFINDVDTALLQRLVNPAIIRTVDLQQESEVAVDVEQQEARNRTLVQLFAILLTLSLFGTNGYLMQTVIEEKETRLIEILISSVRPLQLLVGKIFALGLLGIFQLSVYVGAIFLAMNVFSGTDTFLSGLTVEAEMLIFMAIYFVLGYLLFAAAFGAIGAISTSLSEGPSISVIFVLPAILPWILAPIFAEEPHGTAAVLMSLFPITAPMAMVMRASVTNVPLIEIIVSVGLLVIAIVGMMWFAGRLFRVQTLLSGKLPGFRDIPKLISG